MESESTDNKSKIWGWASVVGVLAFLLLKFLVGYSFWPALLLAILIGILVAILLWVGIFRDAENADSSASAEKAIATPATAATKSAAQASGLTKQVKSAPVEKAAKKSTAATKPKAKASNKSKKATAVKASAKQKTTSVASATDKETAASIMGDAGAAMVSDKKAASAKTQRAPVAKDGKPAVLKKARAGGADDLKLIKGVGPGLEKTLNELGFYHFDQIAGWRKPEIEWVDSRLKFKGRIVRDDWVKQCKGFAKKSVKK